MIPASFQPINIFIIGKRYLFVKKKYRNSLQKRLTRTSLYLNCLWNRRSQLIINNISIVVRLLALKGNCVSSYINRLKLQYINELIRARLLFLALFWSCRLTRTRFRVGKKAALFFFFFHSIIIYICIINIQFNREKEFKNKKNYLLYVTVLLYFTFFGRLILKRRQP